MTIKISEAIAVLERSVKDARQGLPEDIFYFVSRLTPLVNVDLLIKDERGRTLLSWRDDRYAGKGWHLPGGIVRFKEKLETRVRKVAADEIGAVLKFESEPLALNQMIGRNTTRGHFVALLYKCSLPGKYRPRNRGRGEKEPGYLKWHEACPADLIGVHEIYR